eukprot:TRINITY_DN10656_c0_g1_i1.p2 TRINITY_DN10656_c0_g1~~TRINITY_DN10656_c0_g1_i1.p2  ORF type:complete len:320 (+),score=85.28 TRINITY_DN10656_c0_g1_i1:2080-3039(+)
MAQNNDYTFELNERVWVESRGHQYEGRVKKRKFHARKGRNEYLIKYKGFGDRNNQWVAKEKIVRHSEEVAQAAKARQEQALEEERRAKERSRSSSVASNGKRPSSEAGREPASEPIKMKLIKTKQPSEDFILATRQDNDVNQEAFFRHLRLPPVLATHVQACYTKMDDDQRYLPLPRDWTVATLLNKFLTRKAVRSMNLFLRDKEAQCCQSLRAVFEASVGSALLMPIERYQHFQLTQRGVAAGQFGEHYGVEHFLRMICVMPRWGQAIQAKCNFIDKDYGRIVERIFKLIIENIDQALPDDMVYASQDYLRLCTFAGM